MVKNLRSGVIDGLVEAGLELVLGSGVIRGNTFIFCLMIKVHPQFSQKASCLPGLGEVGSWRRRIKMIPVYFLYVKLFLVVIHKFHLGERGRTDEAPGNSSLWDCNGRHCAPVLNRIPAPHRIEPCRKLWTLVHDKVSMLVHQL